MCGYGECTAKHQWHRVASHRIAFGLVVCISSQAHFAAYLVVVVRIVRLLHNLRPVFGAEAVCQSRMRIFISNWKTNYTRDRSTSSRRRRIDHITNEITAIFGLTTRWPGANVSLKSYFYFESHFNWNVLIRHVHPTWAVDCAQTTSIVTIAIYLAIYLYILHAFVWMYTRPVVFVQSCKQCVKRWPCTFLDHLITS